MNGYIENPKCKTCLYSTQISDCTCCYYVALMKKRRGCPVDKCDKYEPFNQQERRTLSGMGENNSINKLVRGWLDDDRFRL